MDTDSNLQAPTALSATGVSEGLNRIEFSAGDRAEGTEFEIWRRHGDTVDWYLHAKSTERAYDDSVEVEPGQYYEYKVRAVRGDSTSEFSPSAVVYGK